MFNLEFVRFYFPVEHLRGNTPEAWERLSIKLHRTEVKMEIL